MGVSMTFLFSFQQFIKDIKNTEVNYSQSDLLEWLTENWIFFFVQSGEAIICLGHFVYCLKSNKSKRKHFKKN